MAARGARATTDSRYRILHQGAQEPLYNMTAFKEGLREIGIIEGENVTIEDRAADGHAV